MIWGLGGYGVFVTFSSRSSFCLLSFNFFSTAWSPHGRGQAVARGMLSSCIFNFFPSPCPVVPKATKVDKDHLLDWAKAAAKGLGFDPGSSGFVRFIG